MSNTKNKNLTANHEELKLSKADMFLRRIFYRLGEKSLGDNLSSAQDYEVRKVGAVRLAKQVGLVALTAATLFVGARFAHDHNGDTGEKPSGVEYVVQSGDTATKIVHEFGGSKGDIDKIQGQGTGEGHMLMAGDKISVPPDMASSVIKQGAEYHPSESDDN